MIKKSGKTQLRQALDNMKLGCCPVTGNVPTRMTQAGFDAACKGFQEQAHLRRGLAKFQAKKYAICRECLGECRPKGLEIISISGFAAVKEGQVTTKKMNGTCEVCGREKMMVRSNNGVICCSGCTVLQAAIKKMPDKVVAEVQRLQGDEYFPAVPVDRGNDQQRARGVIQAVRHALGIEDGERVEDLAERVKEEVERVNYFRGMVEDRNLKVSELMVDVEEQDDIIKDLSSQKGELLEVQAADIDMVPVARLLKDNTLLSAVNTLAASLREAA